jgi:hypothetical protein
MRFVLRPVSGAAAVVAASCLLAFPGAARAGQCIEGQQTPFDGAWMSVTATPDDDQPDFLDISSSCVLDEQEVCDSNDVCRVVRTVKAAYNVTSFERVGDGWGNSHSSSDTRTAPGEFEFLGPTNHIFGPAMAFIYRVRREGGAVRVLIVGTVLQEESETISGSYRDLLDLGLFELR